VSEDRINAAFTRSARAAGLPKELTLHCLRHSYVIYGGSETMRHVRAA
jgi:integrase